MLALLFLSLSIIFLSLGIYRLKGPVSVWYLARSVYAVSFPYLAIPFGVVMLLWALASSPLVPDDWKLNLFTIGAIGGFLSIFLTRLFKPSWLKWLEQEHKEILPLLREEIYEMGYYHWDKQVNTQRDLEEWVAEVRRKYKL